MARIDVEACAQMVSAAAKQCQPLQPVAPVAPPPDKAADMLAGVANAIGLATLGVAILAIAAAIGWLYYVRHRSKVEAAAEVQKIAPEHVRAYLDAADIPGMVADQVAQIMAQRGGLSAEEQAQELSEDPE